MQELERYFKICFDEGGNDNMGYYIEEENISSEFEYIPLLAQGYVRCLNCLRKSLFSYDEEASLIFRTIIREILLLSTGNIVQIRNHYNNDTNFNVFKFLIDKDTEIKAERSLLEIFNAFHEIKNKNKITANVNIKYEIKTGTKGRAVIYNPSIKMNSLIQIQSYAIMLAHLLPRITDFKSFSFFLKYMIEIENEIDRNDYTSVLGMAKIIKNSSNNFRKIVNQWADKDDNDLLMVFCVPKF